VACCLKERRKTWAPTIGGLSRCIVVGVVMLSAAKAAGKSAELEASGAGATAGQLLELILICVMAHLIVVGLLELLGRGLRFAKSTRIAVVFVGAQKTLPVGIYMLTIFFTGMELGVFSLVAYHSLQLVIDTFLIDVYTRASDSTRSA
jgi:predicted Na+-dependent transporter